MSFGRNPESKGYVTEMPKKCRHRYQNQDSNYDQHLNQLDYADYYQDG